MATILTKPAARNPLGGEFSRRNFHKLASLLAAGAALPFYNERALAQLSMVRNLPPDAVKINANENPMGPCPEAAEAIHAIVQKGGRYMYEETFAMASTLAEQEGVKFSYDPAASYVQAFAGSSDPLHRAVLAFCSKDKPFVVADPGYEAGARAAKFIGARGGRRAAGEGQRGARCEGPGRRAPQPRRDLRLQSEQPHRHRDFQSGHRVAGGEPTRRIGGAAG